MTTAPAADPAPHRTRFLLNTPRRESYCEIVIGEGALGELPDLLRHRFPGARAAAVADSGALALHEDRLRALLPRWTAIVEVPSGEENKTRAQKERVEDALLARRLGRDTVIVGFGGGVVTDLAGFVAATYLRGVPFIAVPTTLLAAVDASVGGKTGVNTPRGKNLVGAFSQPATVLADTGVLETLPDAEYRNGLAEAVKMAATNSASDFRAFEAGVDALRRREPAALTRLVAASVETKAGIVGEDELERGLREVLNFGHTVGHGLERASNYRLPHGAAVAVGIVAESRIARHMGVLDAEDEARVVGLLAEVGLPDKAPAGVNRRAVIRAIRSDKKVRGRKPRFVLLEAIGRVYSEEGAGQARSYAFPAPDEALDAGLSRIGL